MTEKVVLTKEQAEAIERWENGTQLLKAAVVGLLKHGEDEPIAEMPTETLAKAIYIGYEVEPEFKVGDFVFYELDNKIGEVYHVLEDKLHIRYADGNTVSMIPFWYIRHATPSEIAEEKERRWWAEHGRDVWELKRGDIVRLSNGWIIEIDSIDLSQVFAVRFINQSYVEDGALLKNVQKLIIPVENRLDVKTDAN